MTISRLVRGLLAMVCVGLAAAGCGNIVTTEIVGATGVTVSQQGDPEAVIVVCRGSVDLLGLYGDGAGFGPDQENPQLGQWASNDPISRGVHRVPLAGSTARWSLSGSFQAFEPGRGYILLASSSQRDLETSQEAFKEGDLEGLDS